MKKIKVILSVLVVFCLMFSLVACSEKNVNPQVNVADIEVAEPNEPPAEVVEEKEVIPVAEDGFKYVEEKEITLTYIGDAISNNEHYATLNGYNLSEDLIEIMLSSDILPSNVKVNVLNNKEEVVQTVENGITFETTGDITTIRFDRTVVEESLKDNSVIFVITTTETDTVINVDVNMSM